TSLAAAAVVVGGVAGVVLPVALGRRRFTVLAHPGGGKPFAAAATIRFAAPAAAIAAADQLLVNGAPLFVVVEGGAHARKTAGDRLLRTALGFSSAALAALVLLAAALVREGRP